MLFVSCESICGEARSFFNVFLNIFISNSSSTASIGIYIQAFFNPLLFNQEKFELKSVTYVTVFQIKTLRFDIQVQQFQFMSNILTLVPRSTYNLFTNITESHLMHYFQFLCGLAVWKIFDNGAQNNVCSPIMDTNRFVFAVVLNGLKP